MKKRKKLKTVLIIFLLIVLFMNFNAPWNRIIRLVKSNIDVLNQGVQTNQYHDASRIKGIEEVRAKNTSNGRFYIEYYCHGFGIAPASIYYGFYYHSVDEPVGYDGEIIPLKKDGKGWSWQEPDGDNRYYTEKIFDNWYYYEVSF